MLALFKALYKDAYVVGGGAHLRDRFGWRIEDGKWKSGKVGKWRFRRDAGKQMGAGEQGQKKEWAHRAAAL